MSATPNPRCFSESSSGHNKCLHGCQDMNQNYRTGDLKASLIEEIEIIGPNISLLASYVYQPKTKSMLVLVEKRLNMLHTVQLSPFGACKVLNARLDSPISGCHRECWIASPSLRVSYESSTIDVFATNVCGGKADFLGKDHSLRNRAENVFVSTLPLLSI